MSVQSITLDELADVFEELRTSYKEEYHLYQLSKLAGTGCVLFLWNVFSAYRLCSLAIECVLLR